MTQRTIAKEPRPLGPAMTRGLRRRCPACGEGAMFDGFLKVRDACPACGQALHHHRADDAPAWATMLIVGHVMVPLIFLARDIESMPVWAHMTVWPLAALGLSLAILPRLKGAIVAYQWAVRMHGFED
jgi:uncharacterized protein (DUF983 family)